MLGGRGRWHGSAGTCCVLIRLPTGKQPRGVVRRDLQSLKATMTEVFRKDRSYKRSGEAHPAGEIVDRKIDLGRL